MVYVSPPSRWSPSTPVGCGRAPAAFSNVILNAVPIRARAGSRTASLKHLQTQMPACHAGVSTTIGRSWASGEQQLLSDNRISPPCRTGRETVILSSRPRTGTLHMAGSVPTSSPRRSSYRYAHSGSRPASLERGARATRDDACTVGAGIGAARVARRTRAAACSERSRLPHVGIFAAPQCGAGAADTLVVACALAEATGHCHPHPEPHPAHTAA